jgi:hypothetical protein
MSKRKGRGQRGGGTRKGRQMRDAGKRSRERGRGRMGAKKEENATGKMQLMAG